MSFRQFDAGLPDAKSSEWDNGAPDAEALRGLHHASESVLRLATQTHQAVARGDAAAAEMARAALEQQLGVTTRMIDALLLEGTDQPTAH
ncbi:MAG TPA: hypothetical protein VFE79_04740 [Paraburkholderia sp.]|jgi:hypothetical protein|nr:hypothetical protein [Paraburkholderia sp.]